jgi:hypothetical protein
MGPERRTQAERQDQEHKTQSKPWHALHSVRSPYDKRVNSRFHSDLLPGIRLKGNTRGWIENADEIEAPDSMLRFFGTKPGDEVRATLGVFGEQAGNPCSVIRRRAVLAGIQGTGNRNCRSGTYSALSSSRVVR